MDVIAIIISGLALISSVYIGIRQIKIDQQQMEMQDIAELYLLADSLTIRYRNGDSEETHPVIYIRNIGNNVVYLQKYIFNGREFPLGKYVLPPVASFDGFRYIFLPESGMNHVSFEIFYQDWKKRNWHTVGYADLQNGGWELTYSPGERIK